MEKELLKHADNLSRTLQPKDIFAAKAQAVAELSVKTLQMIRNDDHSVSSGNYYYMQPMAKLLTMNSNLLLVFMRQTLILID